MMPLNEIRQKIKENLYTTKGKFVDGNCSSKRFKSPIWSVCDEIFDENNEKISTAVYCVKCQTVFKYDVRSNGTSQILKHGCLSDPTSQKITGFGVTKDVTISSTDKQKVKDSAVAFVSKDLRPFEALNGRGLFELIQMCILIGAKYGILDEEQVKSLIPSPVTVSRCVNDFGGEIKKALYMKIRERAQNGLAFTTDLWTDNYKRISYLVITAHFIDKKINCATSVLRDQILCLVPLSVYEKKTGEYLSGVVDDALDRIGLIPFVNKMVFVTDRGSNIRNAFRMLNITRLNCFDHLLNNVVGAVCSMDIVDSVLAPVRKLVKFIKIGGHNNKFEKGLKSHCPTRWNTNHDMGDSVEENFERLDEVLTELNEQHRLTAINRVYLKEVIAFLKLFKMISVQLEKSNEPTLHLVWPSSVRIVKYITQVSAMDSVLLKKMKKYALAYFQKKKLLSKFHRIGCILHPQLKSLRFASDAEKTETIRDLKELFAATEVCSTVATERTRRRRSNDSVLSDYFDDDYDVDEVEMYIGQKIGSGEIDLLKWWDDHKESYPKLHRIAMFIHSIPATSAPSERKFSLAGNVLSCLRSSLDPMKVENLLLLHSNSSEFDGNHLLSFYIHFF